MFYTDELLDKLRTIGDPEPDRIMGELARDGQIDEVNEIMQYLVRNSQPVPEELPDNIEFWLKDHLHLPAGVDRARLNRASRFFVDYGLAITLLLSTNGLVSCYAAQKGVKVMTFTYRMGQTPYHRIAETGQFVLFALTPGGLYEGGQGLLATLKVRLMHAAIRHLIRRTGRWDEAELGVPICQEDMLGTLMVFSYGVIWGLRELGREVTDEQAEDYLYAWKVIGTLLGVDPTVLPEDMQEAETLSHMIARRHYGPTPDGVYLTRALLEMHADVIPGSHFDGLIPALIRHNLGDELADWLEIPRSRWDVVIRHKRVVGRVLETFDRELEPLADVVDQMGVRLLHRESIRGQDYERGGFKIPEELDQSWEQQMREQAARYEA